MDLIMQMLAKLPPERLGQLVAQVQQPQKAMDISPNRQGMQGNTMSNMMQPNQDIYNGPIGRM